VKPLPSIHARLARALLVWSIVWSLAVSLAVWLAVRQQVDQLLDDGLQSAAELLSAPLMSEDAVLPTEAAGAPSDDPGADPGSAADEPDGGFVWQVVQYSPANGAELLFSSAEAPTAALRATPELGFSDEAGWRVFGTSLTDARRLLYVAQTHAERDEVQIEVALSIVAATLGIGLLAYLWLRARLRYELLPLQHLADRLAVHDPLLAGERLGVAEREELQPMHAALDTLADRLARRVLQR
jgi:hypothetical protein